MSTPRPRTGPNAPEPTSRGLLPEELIRFKVKAELRKRMRGLRRTAPIEACSERSAKIVAALDAHAATKGAKSVALFWPILERHEVDLRRFDEALRARSVRVSYPTIDPETGDMHFRFVDDPATLADAGYGFAEPASSDPLVAEDGLDLVIVPALAIDPFGHRIGYGAGYYDRTLPRYAPPAVTIAVAYDWQLVAEVPATPGDVRVDWVLTDLRVFEATPPA